MNRNKQQQLLLQQQQQQMADNEAAALAAEMFDLFCVATTMRQVLGLYRNMCDTIGLRPAPYNDFYPKLKQKVRSWKAQALWKKFDARASHRVYNKGTASTGTRVLVIGAGPCGLRTAIEAQLLGAKVVVVEKRDRISRNNVLHLWPFVITDLRNLGAKKFYGKFCAGSIDHISIRQLQCILLKVALLLGVEVHEGVSFIDTVEPSEGYGWRAAVEPENHAVSHYEFDVLIGADGKRNTLEGFKRKEFRGKLAIAITANFINKKTEAEAKAEEISGVAFIFNQSFFKELYQTTGIDLENIVYYKDETHYFVMTAKKHSLIDKGVILQDYGDPAELLAKPNVNTEKLLDYAREAAEFSTKYQMPNLEFAVNHYGKPDVAMFDFTSMFQAETSCRVSVRNNYRLMQCLVGDSLLEPFWPTGSGCARGFLSSMDAAYAIKLWSNPKNSVLGVLAQRESIYRLLAQTTPENLQRDTGAYTVDPATRYPNLNRQSVNVWQVKHLIDSDDKAILEQTHMDVNALQQMNAPELTPIRRKRRTGDTLPLSTVLLRWVKAQLHSYDFTQQLNEVSDCFLNGQVLCALIYRYRPDLVDFNAVKELSKLECNDLAFKILERDLKIPRVMTAKDSLSLDSIDSKIWLNYLEQICEVFRGEIPHVKHPKLEIAELKDKTPKAMDFSKLLKFTAKKAKSPLQDVVEEGKTVHRKSILDDDKVKKMRRDRENNQGSHNDTPRRAKKRRSAEKSANIEERQQRLKEIEQNRVDRQGKRRLQRFVQTQNFYKSIHMLAAGKLRESEDSSSPFEDYSIYMYRQQAPEFNDRVKDLEKKLLYPDRERGIPSALPRGADEQFSDRIKDMEQRITSRSPLRSDKKPKDLMRAIGKIDSSDWNVKEIEKKIQLSKKTETGSGKGREKVPKWDKEQFRARQNRITNPDQTDSNDEKFKEIDQTIKNLDKQLKEGKNLEVGERGRNKVASIAGQFKKKDDTSEEKNPPATPKTTTKVPHVLKKQSSEKCHFCKQTVYMMEKIFTEGLTLHRSCLKCHHCHTNLRAGAYAFDRDDPNGRFYCTQHFRLPAKPSRPVVRKGQKTTVAKMVEKPTPATEFVTPEKPKGRTESVAQLELLDRGQTPERIEFENADAMSDGEPSLENIIDENEWTDRNFITSSEESESDLSSSGDSDDESDEYEEANESPIGAQTLQLANDWIGKQRYSKYSDDSDNDFYDSSEDLLDDDGDDSQTEGEELKKAREMRREEVRLMPIPGNIPTDTETEANNSGNAEGAPDKLPPPLPPQDFTDQNSLNSFSSNRSSKTDIEKIERGLDRKVSSEIDAINEKLYNISNIIKLSKDVDALRKERIVKDDIMKKLSLKEKWLSNQNSGSMLSLTIPKRKEEEEMDEEEDSFKDAICESPGKMQIESILQTVKKIELSRQNSKEALENSMSNAMKAIENKNFSNTMKSIESQVPKMPTISKQSSLDISKYFPSQKQEKPVSGNINKNQKTLKDVDINKYFPPSPVPQRKVLTVADQLKQSKEEKKPPLISSKSVDSKVYVPKPVAPPRKQKTDSVKKGSNESLNLKDYQMDGAIDIKKKKPVKIVKKVISKKKKASPKTIKTDEDLLFEEILKDNSVARSPSIEYQKLFQAEKSPSEDVSDKYEIIMEECGMISDKRKKILERTKSLGENEFHEVKKSPKSQGVQGILRRFESFSSNKSLNESLKPLLKAEGVQTGCVNRSIESFEAKSKESLYSPTTDLEKTLEYLKAEWKTEATNFLQKKRDRFFSKKSKSPSPKKEKPKKNLTVKKSKSKSISPSPRPKKNDLPDVLKVTQSEKNIDHLFNEILNDMEQISKPDVVRKAKKTYEIKEPKVYETTIKPDQYFNRETRQHLHDLKESRLHLELLLDQDNVEKLEVPEMDIKMRGKSEEDSIDELFNQLSDDMLVDVEFDSNEDVIAITPKAILKRESVLEDKFPSKVLKNSPSSSPCQEVDFTQKKTIPSVQDEIIKQVYIPITNSTSVKFPKRFVYEEDPENVEEIQISSHIASESPCMSHKDDSSISVNGSPKRDYVSTMEIPLYQVEIAHFEKNTLEIPTESFEVENKAKNVENLMKINDSFENSLKTQDTKKIEDSLKIETSLKAQNTKEIKDLLKIENSLKAQNTKQIEDLLKTQNTKQLENSKRNKDSLKAQKILKSQNKVNIEDSLKSQKALQVNEKNLHINHPEIIEVPLEEVSVLETPKEEHIEETDIASTFEFVELPQENQQLNSNLVEQLEKVAFEAFKEPTHEYHKPSKGYTDWELVEELEKQRREVLLARERVNAARQKHIERNETPRSPKSAEQIRPLHEAREDLIESPKKTEPIIEPKKDSQFKYDHRKKLEWFEKPAYRPDQMKPLHEAKENLDGKSRSENMINLSDLRPPPREKEKSASFNDEVVRDRIRQNLDKKKGISTQSLHSQKSDEFRSRRSSSPMSSSNASTYDNVVPTRPRRNKHPTTDDVGTKILLDRSKMLHDKKMDFMEERMTGSNPYIKKMIQSERRRHSSDDDELAPLEIYRPKSYTHFPTSRAVETRRYENRYNRPSPVVTTSISPTTSHGITSYFKRSPPVSPTLPPTRRERETSKESCIIS